MSSERSSTTVAAAAAASAPSAGRGGMNRVLRKLEASVTSGDFYEAHQMYRTLYFRYVGQKKFTECLNLLYNGAMTFLNCNQQSSGIDLAILVVDTLEKFKEADGETWIRQLGNLLKKTSPSSVERETLISRSVKWSSELAKNDLGHPLMHKLIAQIMWSEGNIELARHHLLLSRDGASCGEMLVHLSLNKGYPSETDLFIAQIILQQLCLKETKIASETFETYTKYHPKIARTEPPFMMPLLNFIFFLLKAIETGGKLVMFKTLCDLYKVSIDRDPAYEKYLQKIGILFFGAVPPQQPGMGGIFGTLFNRMFQSMGEDDEPQQGQPQMRSTAQQHSTGNRSQRNETSSELD